MSFNRVMSDEEIELWNSIDELEVGDEYTNDAEFENTVKNEDTVDTGYFFRRADGVEEPVIFEKFPVNNPEISSSPEITLTAMRETIRELSFPTVEYSSAFYCISCGNVYRITINERNKCFVMKFCPSNTVNDIIKELLEKCTDCYYDFCV